MAQPQWKVQFSTFTYKSKVSSSYFRSQTEVSLWSFYFENELPHRDVAETLTLRTSHNFLKKKKCEQNNPEGRFSREYTDLFYMKHLLLHYWLHKNRAWN